MGQATRWSRALVAQSWEDLAQLTQITILAATALVTAVVGWVLRWPAWRKAPDTIAVYWLTVGGAWLLLVLLAQANPRNLVPLLPIVAILLAESLRALARPLAIRRVESAIT